jgi:carboxylate-amine ligase
MVAAETRPLDADALRAPYEGITANTVGVEEELLLVDPETLDLEYRSERVLARLAGDPRFKHELLGASIETATGVHERVGDLAVELHELRELARVAAAGFAELVGVGVYPLADGLATPAPGERYAAIMERYGIAAALGCFACGLHVHVGVPGAERALHVTNAVRSYLPELALLASNAPFFRGRDSLRSSIRPRLAEGFPRQGIPPVIESWERYAEILAWGRTAAFSGPGELWYEVRPTRLGTIEVRVCDQPTRARDAVAICAVIQALVRALSERYDDVGWLPVHPTERIAENRWRAANRGLAGSFLDLDTGEEQAASARLRDFLTGLLPHAEALGTASELGDALELARLNGSERQRLIAHERGIDGLARWLVAETFSG